MTTEPTPSAPAEPKPDAPRRNPLTMPVLLAGLMGGLLGGLFGFTLTRVLPAAPKPPPPPPPSEARQFADHVLGKLKDGKNDEFMAHLRPAFAQLTDEQFVEMRKGLFDQRAERAKAYQGGVEFEFCRDAVLSPTLVRVIYLEKYAQGCLLWVFVVYNAPGGWQVVGFSVQGPEHGYTALQ